MRAMRLGLPGDPSDGIPGALELVEMAVPEPGPGEVLVEVAFAGCNFADTMMWRGTYPHPKGYPLVAGLELSGRVAALGPGVAGAAVGDRVAAFVEDAGAFAEFCVVPAERLIPVPDDIGLDVAAAFPTQALTAWHMLHTIAQVRAGDLVLVHAVGGGVGLCLTQLAVAAGAIVIGTVGTPGKEARARAVGATAVVDRSAGDFVAAIEGLVDRPFDKVFDSTGATILDRSFALVRPLGHVVSFGEAEGRPLPNLWERLVRKSLTFSRFHLGHVDFGSEAWRSGIADVTGALRTGALRVFVERTFPLAEVEAMLRLLESRSVSGKLLVSVGGPLPAPG